VEGGGVMGRAEPGSPGGRRRRTEQADDQEAVARVPGLAVRVSKVYRLWVPVIRNYRL
jgi:hypothetical protein